MTLNSPKCTICHKKSAVTQNRIDGRYLCKVCFTRWIQRTVKRSIKKYNMFERDDRIIVGFSGGKDSTVLLHVLDA
ncbi:MAG: hypothetical protein U9O98_06725, partial [Asgard group archaeon]|nr:hypothetical protein [Asgard group archaeon]